jgi:protein-S-isoprenylcysteine O-methyltransferase Ste14
MAVRTLTQKTRVQLGVRAVLGPLVAFALIFGLAGRLDYWQGWVYIALSTAIVVLMGTVLTPHPELIEERLNPKQGMKSWDKLYFGLSTPMYLICMLVGGLDARFGWTRAMPPLVYWSSVALYLLGQGIFLWARYTNRFFSSVVRIQTDRGQTVCNQGPYRIVRHPGYVGGIIMAPAMGLVLGSWWAVIPQLFASLLLIWRTAREDKVLQAELPGYTEFAQETKYRLLPGIW